MNFPKISIVIPSYNQGQYLEETILSLINQQYPDLELFVVDGGSIDNSVDIIKKYEPHISWWISEKDKGQSDAINKGFARQEERSSVGCVVMTY
jgi:glycosyltransferase involved in cell wall biosynthesis